MNSDRFPVAPPLLVALLLTLSPGAGVAVAKDSESLKKAADLFAAGKWEAAEAAYEEALAEKPDADTQSEALLKLGYCQERQDQWENAIATYRKILDSEKFSEPRKATANLRTGYSMRRNGQDREAIAFLLAAAENEEGASNTRAEGYLYTAWAYGVLDEKDKALETFYKVETVPEAHRNLVATAYLNIGRQLRDRGKYEEAIAAFKRIAEFDPVAATNRSRARIYVLECEALLAGDNPFHIKPCVVDVTGTTARLFWVSQGESPPAGEVLIETSGSSRVESATASPIRETICRKHVADLKGLSPGAKYQYEVTCGDEKVAGSFRTAPPAGSGFSFSVIGDTQSYFERLQPLLDALGEEKTDFVIHVGDLVDKGDLWGEWKAGFFDPGWSYLQHSILRPTFGNHDGGPFYPAFFKSPEGQLYYSFDWGDAHFVVLDSYGSGSGGAGRAAQLEWLEADLAANEKPWTIVSLHVPMVATRSRIKWFGKDDFLPLLEKHGVDLVFSGHHPLYRRYLPIGDSAILHVTSGGGGGPVGGFVPSPLLEKGVNANHYCRVEVTRDRLMLEAKDIDGKVIDRFELNERDGDWRTTMEATSVDSKMASKVLPLYQELLTDRTFEMVLSLDSLPKPGERVTLTLDLNRLPRGPFDPSRGPLGAMLEILPDPDGAWSIDTQAFRFQDEIFEIDAIAPEEGLKIISGGRVVPGVDLELDFRIGGNSDFERFKTKARIVLSDQN